MKKSPFLCSAKGDSAVVGAGPALLSFLVILTEGPGDGDSDNGKSLSGFLTE